MDAAEFRHIMGHFATGVTVVTSRDPASGQPCGLTANTMASVSLEPTLVLTCVDLTADSHDCILEAGFFAINILASNQESISRRFSRGDQAEKFIGVPYRTEATGAPILEDTLAWLDCRIWARYPGGDHTIIVGEVAAGGAVGRDPLLYFRGGYGEFVS